VERFEESVSAYRAALQLVPNEPGILHNMGVSLLRLGRLDDAREQLERAAALGLPEAWRTLAVVLEVLGLKAEAEKCRKKAEDCRPAEL
jgi:Flp pilus assembly protein TadD